MDIESEGVAPLKVSVEFPPGVYMSRRDTVYPLRGQQFYVEGSAVFDSGEISVSLVCGFFLRDGQSVRRVFTISDFRHFFTKA